MQKLMSLTFALLLLLAPNLAQAQTAEPGAAAAQPAAAGGTGGASAAPAAGTNFWPPNRNRARGLLFQFGFGGSGCTDDLCENLDPMVYLRFQASYRLLNYLAVGLHLGIPFFDADSRSVDAAYNVFLGPEVRGILPLGPIDVWTGVAFGWFRTEGDGEVCIGGFCADGSAWADGFGFAWGLGALYFVTRRIGVGVDFWLYTPVLDRSCYSEGGDRSCGDVDDQNGVGITWMVGLTAAFFLPM